MLRLADSPRYLKIKMKLLLYVAGALALCAAVVACDENSPVGESIADDAVRITIDSSFTVTGRTVETGAVQSRTIDGLLGSVDIPGYGSLRSDIVAQFMPASILDTTNVSVDLVDSVKLVFKVPRGSYVGDSLAPMGVRVYPLTKELPSPIFSDFDPDGYYDSSSPLGSKTYNTSALGLSDTIGTWSEQYIDVTLPDRLAKDFYRAYKANPSNFATPDAFVGNVFKGLYIANSYGSGRVTHITQTVMRMYYRRKWYDEENQKDSINSYATPYFAVTPEVVVNNNISLEIDPAVTAMADAGETILLAPAGMEVELAFPGREIAAKYIGDNADDVSVLNSLTFSIPVEEIGNDYGIAPPPYVLLVLKSRKDEFFSSNSLTDNVTSFYAAYDSTNHRYMFSGMRSYLLDLLSKDTITDDDVTFTLCAVNVTTESTGSGNYYYSSTSTTESAITPYVSKPAMAKILLGEAKIKLTYSSQSINY